MSDEPASRREFDQLVTRVNLIDEHGTRGVGVIQVQLTEVVKDVAKLESEMTTRFTEHQRQHDTEQANRAANRRWAIGLAVALLAAIGGLYPYLHVITAH